MNENGDTRLRVFMGMPLSPEIRRYVLDIRESLTGCLPEVRWVKPENLHVTLKFIGYCDVDDLGALIDLMKKACVYLPLTLGVGGIGGFPSQGSARVIWVGAKDEENKVDKLYGYLERGAEKVGFPREKRHYKPHITVGRAKRTPVRIPPGMVSVMEPVRMLKVEDMVLFRSVLKKTGAEYSVIERVGVKD
jgi:2'-5' RNA ligase